MRTIASVSAIAGGADGLITLGPYPPGAIISEVAILMDKGTTAADTFYQLAVAAFANEPTPVADFDSGQSFCKSSTLITDAPAVRAVRGQTVRIPVNMVIRELIWLGVLVRPVTDAMSGTASVSIIPTAA